MQGHPLEPSRTPFRTIGLLLALAITGPAGAVSGCEPAGQGEEAPEESEPSGESEAGAGELSSDSLRAELLAMGQRDQEVRADLSPETMGDTAFLRRMMRTDSALGRRLREIVETRGWPRAEEVGEEAAEAAFLVVQHTPFEDWQREMLPEIRAAVKRGDLGGQQFTLLFDRIRTKRGEPQRYGTQLRQAGDSVLVLEPLEDPQAVDSLRAAMGLPPLEAYLELVEENTGFRVVPDTGRRSPEP